MAEFVEVTLRGLQFGSVYALVGMGISIILAVMRVLNFAHGEMFMVGTVLAWGLWAQWHIPLVVALAISVVLVALVAVVQERFTIRPVLKVSGAWGWALSSFGFAVLLQWIAGEIVLDNQPRSVPFILPRQYVTVGDVTINLHTTMMIGIAIAVAVAIHLLMRRSLLGKAIVAVAQNPELAYLRGIDVPRLMTAMFAVGSAIAGLAGFLLSPYSYVDAHVGFNYVLKGFVAGVLGGVGNVMGALLGGFILGLFEQWGGEAVGLGYRDALVVALLLALLLFRPSGLFGERGRLV